MGFDNNSRRVTDPALSTVRNVPLTLSRTSSLTPTGKAKTHSCVIRSAKREPGRKELRYVERLFYCFLNYLDSLVDLCFGNHKRRRKLNMISVYSVGTARHA